MPVKKMKHTYRNTALLLLGALLLSFAAGCSSRGVHMPKHRKRRHCDCPTFSEVRSEAAAKGTKYFQS